MLMEQIKKESVYKKWEVCSFVLASQGTKLTVFGLDICLIKLTSSSCYRISARIPMSKSHRLWRGY